MNNKKILIGIVVGLVGVGTIYSFNEEKFYSEYWFQRDVDKSKDIDIRNHAKSNELISYKFYFDPSIDIAIEIDDEGDLLIKRHSWFGDNKQVKNFHFKVGENEFKNLKKEFETHWTKSKSSDAEFRFGGTYYLIELTKLNSAGQSISIGYYNVTPDRSFMAFKEKIIAVAKSGLRNSHH